MSMGISYLHSHSALERQLRWKKRTVLVDVKFSPLFDKSKNYLHNGTHYIEVGILDFVKKGGVFKNLEE
jgi:hypothetical protein